MKIVPIFNFKLFVFSKFVHCTPYDATATREEIDVCCVAFNYPLTESK